jgi:hypothetical protein
MPLPTVNAPKYSCVLPQSKKKITFRPFRVKEEKILMLAAESGDLNDIYQSVHDIILSCTDGTLNIFKESSVDSEYALIRLRASSVGETMKPHLTCVHCENKCSVKISMKDLIVDNSEEKENRIEVSKDMILELKYPSFAEEIRNDAIDDRLEMVFDSVICSIEKIYFQDEVYDISEYTKEEVKDFVDNLDTDVFKKIVEYLAGKPKVKIPVKFVCPACKKKTDMLLEGIETFFG